MNPVEPRRRDSDEALIDALALGASYEEAGRVVGLSRSTVKRRMSDDLFRARVAEERADRVRTLRGRIARLGPSALDALEELMANSHQPSIRLGAARTVLRMAVDPRKRFDSIEVGEFQQVISKLMEAASREMPDDAFSRFVQSVQSIAGEP